MTADGTAAPRAVSVLICSRERPVLLGDTIRSVLAADVRPRELLVVDQSREPDPEISALGEVGGCRIRYLHSRSTGLSAARNIGLSMASHPVVVLLDDDMLVEPGWLPTLLDGLPPGDRVVATGRVLAAPLGRRGVVVPAASLVTRTEAAVYRGPQPFDVVPGANVALPRDLVLAIGGYDERLGAGSRFPAADDNDIGHRLLAAGCEVHHVPEAVVLHRSWRSRREVARLRFDYARGKGGFYAKHMRLGDRHVRHRATAEVRRRVTAAAASWRSPRTGAAELLSLAGLAVGALEWLVRERDTPEARNPGK